ncbi:MAG: ABC transporter ATP-binding protein [Saprospiraceae bacterium]|nr:ABC transporter ATP-binding protein [Saprospiraceae bacterium]
MSAVIQLHDIKKTYITGRVAVHALKNISLNIGSNEYVALMGPSGSGKSTLMNLLGCLDTPSGGSYILNGKDVSTLTENDMAIIRNEEIGFVFQSFNLMPRLNALENVSLPLIYAGKNKKYRRERAAELLEAVGLGDRMDHKPNELSGGQIQRVAIARSMANNPSIILADEPTGNLDTKTSYEIMDLFAKIQEDGNTVILVTHEEDIAARTKRIIRLRDGEVETDVSNTPVIHENIH